MCGAVWYLCSAGGTCVVVVPGNRVAEVTLVV